MQKFLKKNHKKAFSLIELSIVILIVSILITGALSVSINTVSVAKNKVTKDRMVEIYKAMGNYLLANKKLPCPAPLTDTKSGTSTYGTAASTSLCASTSGVSKSASASNLVRGMVPVKTLGLPLDMAEDGFGDKFEYIVDKNYTVISAGTTPSSGAGDFGTSSTANIIVYEKPGSSAVALTSTSGTSSSNNTNSAVFVIISLGSNKSGAYGYDSSSRNALSTDTEEATNTPTSTSDGTTYGSNIYASSGNSDVFDDIVLYKTRDTMISDFNAFSLVPCLVASESLYGGTINWPIAWYDQIQVATSPTCTSLGYNSGPTYPAKRCGAFGVWDVVTNPCLQ